LGGGGESTGTAWWDDVSLHEVEYEIIEQEAPEITAGDVERGRQIYHQHEIAACVRCHMIDGNGGPIGPALDGIASRKSEEYIHESLVSPSAQIAEGFDAKVSPMPPMGVILTEQELADVMAYLMTLK
ncbi:MAG: cytochrome c, partial [Verrucomicrobiota bacterium]